METDTPTWRTVDQLVAWLDAHSAHDPEGRPLQRILKLSEEVGEVAAAVIGASRANPRKPERSWREVEEELCDVALTALIALRTLTPDAPRVFQDHLARVAARSLASDENEGENQNQGDNENRNENRNENENEAYAEGLPHQAQRQPAAHESPSGADAGPASGLTP